MDAEFCGDLCLVEASFHEGVNLVSLLLGELPIVLQECFLDLVVEK
jgi:hypothetical protein